MIKKLLFVLSTIASLSVFAIKPIQPTPVWEYWLSNTLYKAYLYTDKQCGETLILAKIYTDEKFTNALQQAKFYTDGQCELTYFRAVLDASTNAQAVSYVVLTEAIRHSDTNRVELEEIIAANLQKAFDHSDTNKNEVMEAAGTADTVILNLAKTYADGLHTDAKSYSDGNLDTAKSYSDTNLKTAKTYSDQYANQAPGYSDVKSKAEAALPNTYDAMVSSPAFKNAVDDLVTIPEVLMCRKELETRTDTTSPSVINLSVKKDCVYYTSLSVSNFLFNFICTDVEKDGVYTWEVMLSTDQDISGCTLVDTLNYVGNDKSYNPSLAYPRIDSTRTTHVFAVRMIKVGTKQIWMIAHNYSIKG